MKSSCRLNTYRKDVILVGKSSVQRPQVWVFGQAYYNTKEITHLDRK